MSTSEVNELSDVLNRVKDWPPAQRITLARRILETIETHHVSPPPSSEAPTSPPNPRGLSAAELQALLKTDRPAPDDETVKQWIDEHRMEKYGR